MAHEGLLHIYRHLQTSLEGNLRAVGEVATHGPTIGRGRESIVREALEAQLPAAAMKSGQIVAPGSDPSSEWDVIVCAPEASRALAGVIGLVPIESVLAVISVKSNLTTAAIIECAEAAAQLREMIEPQLAERPLPAIFAFGLDGVGSDTLEAALERGVREHGPLARIDGALVLRRYTALAVGDGHEVQADQDAYCRWIVALSAAVREAPRRQVDLAEYVYGRDDDEPSGGVARRTQPPAGPGGGGVSIESRPDAPALRDARTVRSVVEELSDQDIKAGARLEAALDEIDDVKQLGNSATGPVLEGAARVLSLCDEHIAAAEAFLKRADEPDADRATLLSWAVINLWSADRDRAQALLDEALALGGESVAVHLAGVAGDDDPESRLAALYRLEPVTPRDRRLSVALRAAALSELDRDAEAIEPVRAALAERWSTELAERLAIILLRTGVDRVERTELADEAIEALDAIGIELLKLGLRDLAMSIDARLVVALARTARFDQVSDLARWWGSHVEGVGPDARTTMSLALLDADLPNAAAVLAPDERPDTVMGRLLDGRLALEAGAQEPVGESPTAEHVAAVEALDQLLVEPGLRAHERSAVAHARAIAAAAGHADWSPAAADALEAPELYRDMLLSRHLLARGDLESAESTLLPYMDTPEGLRALIDLVADAGQWDRVLQLIDDGLRADAPPAERFRRADALAKLGREEDAEAAWLEVATSPQTSRFLSDRAWSRLAESLGDRRQWELLARRAQEWHAAHPESHVAVWGAADALIHVDRAQEAWDLITEVGAVPSTTAERQFVAKLASLVLPLPEALARIAALSDEAGGQDETLEAMLISLSAGADREEVGAELDERLRETLSEFPNRFPDSRLVRSVSAPTTDEEWAAFAQEHLTGRRRTAERMERSIAEGESALAVFALLGGTALSVWLDTHLLPLVVPVAEVHAREVDAAASSVAAGAVWDSSALAVLSLLNDDVAEAVAMSLPASSAPRAVKEEVAELDRVAAERDPDRSPGTLSLRGDLPVIVEHSTEGLERFNERGQRVRGLAERLATADPNLAGDGDVATALRDQELHGSAASWLGALLLASERGAPLYCDDRYVRMWAQRRDVRTFGTPALLEALEQRGMLTSAQVTDALWALRAAGGRHLAASADEIVRRIAADGYRPSAATAGLLRDPDGWAADPTGEIIKWHAVLLTLWRQDTDLLYPWLAYVLEAIGQRLVSTPAAAATLLALQALGSDASETAYVRAFSNAVRRCNLELFAVGDPITAAIRWMANPQLDETPEMRRLFMLRAIARLPLAAQLPYIA